MHRNRTWTLDPPEWRTQRNRLLPIEGGDGSTLNLDFTNGVLDPRITFSRLSTATFVNSSGYVEYAGANLFLQSENISSASWTDQAGASRLQVSITNPIGGATSTQVTSGTGSNAILQSPTYQAGLPHVIRIWVRAGTSSQIQLGVYTTSFVTGSISVVSGTATVSGTGLFNVTGLTSTWTQLQIVYTSLPASGAFLVYPDGAGAPVAGRTIYVWGPQLNPGSTAQTYYPTTTVAYHAPRFDYSPTNIGEPRGLLIEGQTTNYVRFSNAPGTTGAGGWSPGGTPTITFGGGAISPDGITTSTRIQFPPIAGATISRIYQETGYPLAAYPYTMSVWMKSNTADNHNVNILGSANTNNVVTPAWQRFVVTVTSSASLYRYFYISNESSTLTTDISIWGAQLEAGSDASSYIPTGASTVQRVGDDCYMSGTNFSSWWNQSEGTAFIETTGMTKPTDLTFRAFTITENLAVPYQIGATWIYDNSGFRITELASSATKHAVALKANNFAISNGDTTIRTGTGAFGTTYNRLQLGAYENQTSYMNGCIKRFKYYPTRLSNTQLQNLTAPDYVAPTLDLNFIYMSTNTDLVTSGLTFSRLSNATFIDANGFLVSAPSNLLVNSVLAGGSTSTSALSNPTGWSIGLSGISYRSTNVIDSCNQWIQTANNQRPYITITIPQSELKPDIEYVASVYVDSLTTGSNFNILGAMLYYNAPTGTTTSSLQWVSPSGQITTDGSGTLTTGLLQLRFKLSVVGVSGFQLRIGIGTYTNATGSVAFSRPQVEQAFSARNYVPNTSTVGPFYGPRFNNTILTSRTNLILQSNNFTIAAGTPWQQKDGTHSVTLTAAYEAAPSGFTGTATRITSSNSAAGITQALNVPLVSGKTIRMSFYAKSNTVTSQNCMLQSNSSTFAVSTIPTTWTRIDEVAVAAVTEITLKGFIDPLDISIYGMQVEYVNSGGATAYILTTTTQGVVNTTAPAGLLMEGATSNFIYRSGELTGYAAYNMIALSIDGTVVDPMGGNKAVRIAANATTNFHGYLQNNTNAGPTTVVTASIFAKRNNYRYLYLFDGSTNTAAARYNLDTGVVDLAAGNGYLASRMTPYANGWWRCELIATVAANVARAWGFQGTPDSNVTYAAGNTGASYLGTGLINDGIYVSGWQVEAGYGASSYIPTGSSLGLRTGDACVMSDITALKYSTQKGSIYWRGIINKQPTSYTTLIGFQATSDQPSLETFGNALNFFTSARGPGLTGGGGNEVSRTFTLNSTIRYASSVNTLFNPIVSINLNGTAGSTDKAGNGNMHAATRFVIGRQPTAAYEATYPSVTLERIQYYPTALTATQLQTLTA